MHRWRRAALISLVTTSIAFASATAVSPDAARAMAWNAAWTFPIVLLAAFVVAWAAEAAQFLMSQGMALAVLALLQTLPEFAVEAVLAWKAAHDPSFVSLVSANFTGSHRLLVGVGMPMIYFVQVLFRPRAERSVRANEVRLQDQHSVEVFWLLPPILYFFLIWWKGTLTLLDAFFLLGMYALYLYMLSRLPAEEEEKVEDLGWVPRKVMSYRRRGQWVGVVILFVVGGGLLYATVEPFVGSMLGLAALLGVTPFIFTQWVSPFLSEFPEKVSAFYWARTVSKAPMAMMNIVSSNINQWTLLPAMIPIVYCYGRGTNIPIPFDAHQRVEILLTAMQSLLSFMLLVNLRFHWFEAIGLFVLFTAQFCIPSLREEITYVYVAWVLIEILLIVTGRRETPALDRFAGIYRRMVRGEPITFVNRAG